MNLNKKGAGKVFAFVILGLFLINFMSGFVMAQRSAEEAGKAAAEGLKVTTAGVRAFFESLFDDTIIGNATLSKILMAILLAMFVYTAFGAFFGEDKNTIRWIATAATTALAIFAIPTDLLLAIRTNYGAMGSTILTIIPFLVILWFSIKVRSYVVAKGIWLVFGLYSLYLLGNAFINPVTIDGETASRFPYFIVLIASIIMFLFIKEVRRIFTKGSTAARMERIEKALAQRRLNRDTTARHEEDTTKSIASV